MIVAGDGYAYVAYEYPEASISCSAVGYVSHLRLLQVSSSGAYNVLNIGDVQPPNPGYLPGADVLNIGMITNADIGVLLSWSINWIGDVDQGPVAGMMMTNGTSVTAINPPSLPGQNGIIVPVLQAQDGSFVGTYRDSSGQTDMVAFDQTGNVRWTVPNDQPQIATDDGGVLTRLGVTYDQNGNATGQIANMPAQSWIGRGYEISPLMQIAFQATPQATPPYWSVAQANLSVNSTSPICRDDRDPLIKEYSTFKSGFTPVCSDFTGSNNAQPSPHFSFAQLDISDITRSEYVDWAILRSTLLNGLETTRGNYNNQSITIGSGYRSPKVQNIINPNAPRDRHIHGDAADMSTGNSQTTWNALHNAALATGACVEPELTPSGGGSTVNHVHADWRRADGAACAATWLQ